ncbi:MAG: dTDP-glucose 4,6-dehydratase [Candidatus Omnitrophica bacterium CG11_big_fil_rev_8_21_14_0_20_64_10]|nr:MAG: dTDP-glucose 4,6-dehydratase [Candidatus Omnitrophica bacterium CG11_big_fil_rev_8_21_14_0_20_64_10]
MTVLVTGGAGFIGSHFVRSLLRSDSADQIVNLDNLTYAGSRDNLADLSGEKRHRFIQGDVADPRAVAEAVAGCDQVVHFAAETHVDRSIRDATAFLRTNVLGTQTVLEAARQAGVKRYIQISTDEVYGPVAEGAADESAPLNPSSPYAASKTAGDHLVNAQRITYGLPVLIVRASNNYGPHQFPEKFLPLMITNALQDKPLPIYGDGLYAREWLFVEDFCEGIRLLMERGAVGEVYNIGSEDHRINLEVARRILKTLGKPESLLQHVTDRPGHDRRYAIRSAKIRALGWKPRHSFEAGLEQTIGWYRDHADWWRAARARA